jgi:uncharacterized protein YciI
MAMFLVWEEGGPAWNPELARREQAGWDEHAEFMDALVEDGFVVLGGPVGDGRRVLLVCDASDEEAVRERLATDPWVGSVLTVASVEPWQVLLDGR